LMNVFGIENVENSDPNRPVILVANHRSFFDMYTVSSYFFRYGPGFFTIARSAGSSTW
jgi:1-acyl-sn-glycerol-3-phosphate acyltransferase